MEPFFDVQLDGRIANERDGETGIDAATSMLSHYGSRTEHPLATPCDCYMIAGVIAGTETDTLSH